PAPFCCSCARCGTTVGWTIPRVVGSALRLYSVKAPPGKRPGGPRHALASRPSPCNLYGRARMRTLKPILFLAALIVAATSHAAGLSEQSVRELIAKMDQAARTRSIEPLAEVLSDDAVIRVTVHIERRKRVLDLTKEDYLEMVRRGWARASAYTFQRTALDITIQNPERARVTTEVLESLSM